MWITEGEIVSPQHLQSENEFRGKGNEFTEHFGIFEKSLSMLEMSGTYEDFTPTGANWLIVDLRLGNLSFPTSQSVSNCKNQLKISKNPKFII